ncbi:MAG: acyl--CoA ligase [Lachnospiraceae bacterium]|nr:acyl--CoA ligase [Lachnospiraceae bacterium]
MDEYKQKSHLEYPELTMFQMVSRIADQYPGEPAYEFYGRKTTYKEFILRIERAARAFLAMGIGNGDVVTVCMPNVPQALDCFYALNRIGAVANMIHPLSARSEISFYLNISESKAILTLDMFYEKVEQALLEVKQPVTILVARIQEELNPFLKTAYIVKKGKEYLKFPNTDHAVLWKDFLKKSPRDIPLPALQFDPMKTSVILYSGGTTGTPKGICLSDLNFNACAMQARESIGEEFRTGLKMLSCMPCFHGFGLGINLHTVLIHGACCILMPNFSNKSYARMLLKKKPNFIAGVPTIFEALLHMPELDGADLSFLHGMFCGGDSLSIELKKKIDIFLKEHKADIQVREGYGLTECVTASCLTPRDSYKEGGIGMPFPDTIYRIVKPGTDRDVPPGEEGEIILTGPTLMLGYLNNPKETAETLRRQNDGKTWLYTGDIGRMDEEGCVYYVRRLKRLIITNGYNVYPGQIENVIDAFPDVSYSCVVGVKDPKRMQRVKAYIVLRDGIKADDDCRNRIMDYLKNHIARYALPREIEFRDELPKTLVGKVAYRILEEEGNQKCS